MKARATSSPPCSRPGAVPQVFVAQRVPHRGSAPDGDASWPLLAGLVLSGAMIVSVPRALVEQHAPPGDLQRDPTAALNVLAQFERRLSQPVRSLARLAAGLAAQSSTAPPTPRRKLARLPRFFSRQ